MPVCVTFDPANAGCHPHARRVELGPYDVVQLVGDELFVLDGRQPFILATRMLAGDWVVNGLEGLTFQRVRFVTPVDRVNRGSETSERSLNTNEE